MSLWRNFFDRGSDWECSYFQKYSKEVQEVKQKNQEEIRKLRQQCEDKDDKIKTLNHKLQQDADEKWVIVTCHSQNQQNKRRRIPRPTDLADKSVRMN